MKKIKPKLYICVWTFIILFSVFVWRETLKKLVVKTRSEIKAYLENLS